MKKIIWIPVIGAFFSRWNMFADSALYVAYWQYQFVCLMGSSLYLIMYFVGKIILG